MIFVRSFFCCSIALFAGLVFAHETTGKTSGRVPFSELSATTYAGPKTTFYTIKPSDGKMVVTISSTPKKKPVVRVLSKGGVRKILRSYLRLPNIQKIPNRCRKSRIDIRYVSLDGKERSKQGCCFGAKSSTSKQFSEFAKLLDRTL
jgi:hypothetical protein